MKEKALSQKEIQKKLKELEGWKLNSQSMEISKTFIFKSFKEALRFTNTVGKLAEKANHHPDIALSYGKVKIKLYTHDRGGVTNKDFSLARNIDIIDKT